MESSLPQRLDGEESITRCIATQNLSFFFEQKFVFAKGYRNVVSFYESVSSCNTRDDKAGVEAANSV